MAANKAYEDFEPPLEWTQEDACRLLTVYIPGFSKERLQVQVSSTRNLRISGERPLRDNKWQRLQKEFQIPSNCDANKITANYKGGVLYVRQPYLQTQPPEKQKPAADSETNNIVKQEEARTVVGREEGKAKSDEQRKEETISNNNVGDEDDGGKDTSIARPKIMSSTAGGRWKERIIGNWAKVVSAILLAILVFYTLKVRVPPCSPENLHTQP